MPADGDAPASEATALAPAPLVKREGVSLAEATVALVSLDAAPWTSRLHDFREALARALRARGSQRRPGNKARYRLRVYLSAAPPADGEASLDDVFDAYIPPRGRQARLSDGLAVEGIRRRLDA